MSCFRAQKMHAYRLNRYKDRSVVKKKFGKGIVRNRKWRISLFWVGRWFLRRRSTFFIKYLSND